MTTSRHRALRAARAVTMGALMLAAGCSDEPVRTPPIAATPTTPDETAQDQGTVTPPPDRNNVVVDAGGDLAQGPEDLGLDDMAPAEDMEPPATDMAPSADMVHDMRADMPAPTQDMDTDMRASQDMAVDMPVIVLPPLCEDRDKITRNAGACSDTADLNCAPTCNAVNDADCCCIGGGIWAGGGCAVPGPFTPPALV